MNWTTKGVEALATGTTLFCGTCTVTAVALTGHHGTAPAATAAPVKIVYVPVPASAPSSIVNAEAVVTQYFQDITDHNYSAAWALGGSNLSGGAGCNSWVAGYATTASISLGTFSYFGSDQVQVVITAPDTWIVQTGETLVSDWRNGQTTAQTDQILLAGGILPGHLAAFDSITQQDLGA